MKKNFRIDQSSPNTRLALQPLDESSPCLRHAAAYKPRHQRYQVFYKIIIDPIAPPPVAPPPPNAMAGGEVDLW